MLLLKAPMEQPTTLKSTKQMNKQKLRAIEQTTFKIRPSRSKLERAAIAQVNRKSQDQKERKRILLAANRRQKRSPRITTMQLRRAQTSSHCCKTPCLYSSSSPSSSKALLKTRRLTMRRRKSHPFLARVLSSKLSVQISRLTCQRSKRSRLNLCRKTRS